MREVSVIFEQRRYMPPMETTETKTCRWRKDYLNDPSIADHVGSSIFFMRKSEYCYPKDLWSTDRKRCSRVPVSRPLYVSCHFSLPSSTLWVTWSLSCPQRTAPNFKPFKESLLFFFTKTWELCKKNFSTQFTL